MMPLRRKEWAEMEQLLASRRKRPLELVQPLLATLTVDQQKHLLALAYRDERDGQRVAEWEVKAWMETIEGDLYSTWLMLRQKHPALTLDQLENLVLVEGQKTAERKTAEQRAAKEAAEGMPIGHPFGETQTATESPTIAAMPPSDDTLPGAASIASSPATSI